MKDGTAIRLRRYAVYTVIIVGWTIFLVFATGFFESVRAAKHYLQIP